MLLKLSVDLRGILEHHCDRNKRILVTHKEYVTREKVAQLGNFFLAGMRQVHRPEAHILAQVVTGFPH